MSNPENKPATQTFEEKVNTVVSQFTTDDNGKLALPDGVEVDEATLYAARAEKRRRDTQSAFTKAQQENKRLMTENEKLALSWEQEATSQLPANEQARLEELKHQDPDAWRTELTKLEDEQRNRFQEKREGITKEVSQMTELEQREAQLAAFQEANPGLEITDQAIADEVPPRITRQLEEGKISFMEFLEQSKKYMTTTKVIDKGEKPTEEPKFAESRGGSKPSKEALEAQSSTEYNNEIY